MSPGNLEFIENAEDLRVSREIPDYIRVRGRKVKTLVCRNALQDNSNREEIWSARVRPERVFTSNVKRRESEEEFQIETERLQEHSV